MSFPIDDEFARRKAFDVIVRSLDLSKFLPDKIFIGEWKCFLFCESDRIFSPEFMDVLKRLLFIENAKTSCFLNIDKTEKFEFGSIAAIFLNGALTSEDYWNMLRSGKRGEGWLYQVDQFACASDVGDWCIYCDKGNDVAVVGLRELSGREKFEIPLQQLWAKPIEELIDGGACPLFPFNCLVPAWRKGLVENYGNSPHICDAG